MENSNYTSYQGITARADAVLSGMEGVCGDLEMDEARKALVQDREKLESRRFTIGVMGNFKRGMSTVINALLGQELLPTDILPCTAVPVRVTYGAEPRAELRMHNGSVRRIGVEELTDYVTKLTSENESPAANVDEAVVFYPCRFCQDGMDIVDTPGLNDNERTDKISEEIIPKLDAAIMVIVPGSPFAESEQKFLCDKLMNLGWDRLIFLINKIDTIRKDDLRILAVKRIKTRIKDAVLQKTTELYGESSQQYKDAQMKLDSICILPFSALDALDGKQEGNQDLIEKSGIRLLEEQLARMIVGFPWIVGEGQFGNK